jgi:hypothetical protein
MKTNPKKAPRKVPRNAWKLPPCCLSCKAEDSYELQTASATQEIRGEEVRYSAQKYICTECEATLMSPEQTTQGVKNAVAAYQLKHGYRKTNRASRLHLKILQARITNEQNQ